MVSSFLPAYPFSLKAVVLVDAAFAAIIVAVIAALLWPARRRPFACLVLGAWFIALSWAVNDVLAIPEFQELGDSGWHDLAIVASLVADATGALSAVMLAVAALRGAGERRLADSLAPAAHGARRMLPAALGCAAVLAGVAWNAQEVITLLRYYSDVAEGVTGMVVTMLAVLLALRLRSTVEGGALLLGWSVAGACYFIGYLLDPSRFWYPSRLLDADNVAVLALLAVTAVLAIGYLRRRPAG